MIRKWMYILMVLAIGLQSSVSAQPAPGEVFREYLWVPDMVKESEKFLRVGGRIDYQINENHMPASFHVDGFLNLNEDVDLEDAVRAEVILEMVQSHEDTKGLKIEINGHDPMLVPDFSTLPKPQSAYMLHTYPIVPVPLSYLNSGDENRFRLTVDTSQAWNWPQNIFYGITFRIYYDESKKDGRDAILKGIKPGDDLGDLVFLTISEKEGVDRVDYLGKYTDYDWEGNGMYYQWHGHPHRGELRNHIGSISSEPFDIMWNTGWLPDQSGSVSLMARVHLDNGLIYTTESIDELSLKRDYSVELCRPYHQPENWVTRSDTLVANFGVHGNLDEAQSYQVAWRSWSPCYGRGVFINGHQVWTQEDPCYGYAEHLITVNRPTDLRSGENTVVTGKTPLIDGQMVHGMEVQYPGIMIKVKYRRPNDKGVHINTGIYEGRPHYIVNTASAIYYYDKSGGGLSRMIDPSGHDWIDFRMEPWGEYPASAASAYRGIPNFVHGSSESGAGHPGHDQCVSEVRLDNRINTKSKSGAWEWTWTFYPDHAEVEVIKSDPEHPYWFLYEGVPGGVFDPDRQYFGTSTGGTSRDLPDYYRGDEIYDQWEWAYFGHDDVDRVLYVAHEERDQLPDTFGYLGSDSTGISANDGMVVFGFGREKGAKPLLQGSNRFLVGFMEVRSDEIDYSDISSRIEALRQ